MEPARAEDTASRVPSAATRAPAAGAKRPLPPPRPPAPDTLNSGDSDRVDFGAHPKPRHRQSTVAGAILTRKDNAQQEVRLHDGRTLHGTGLARRRRAVRWPLWDRALRCIHRAAGLGSAAPDEPRSPPPARAGRRTLAIPGRGPRRRPNALRPRRVGP